MGKRLYNVFWTNTAIRDLEDIIGFIAADSPQNARLTLSRLKERAETLESNPARGRVVPELAIFSFSAWRELVVGRYRLIYRIETDKVYVLAVLDARRDLEDLLFKRLVKP